MHFTAVQVILDGSHYHLQGYAWLSHCPHAAVYALAMLSVSLVPKHTEFFLMVSVHTLLPLSRVS